MSICVLPCRTTRPEPSRRSTSMPTRRRCTRRTGRGLVITPGDIAPRRVSNDELYVAVLSNAIHLAADTGRVIACPLHSRPAAGRRHGDGRRSEQPEGTVLPELVQWLVSAALDEPIGTIGAAAQRETAAMVTALNLLIPPVAVQGGGPLSTRNH